jgi:TonB family protein
MGLWEFLQQWPRRRLVAGAIVSLLVHALLTWVVLWGLTGELTPRWRPKPGDTIIVELPRPDETAQAGSPSAPPPPRSPAPPAPATPPKPAAPPRDEPRAASARRAVEPVVPSPRTPEPPPAVKEPAPRVAEPAPSPAEPPAAKPEPAPRSPSPERRSAEREVAALPPRPPGPPSASDVRAALRRGAGGQGQGRGGIEGDPVPLDSQDVQFSEYLEQVRRRIKEKWGFPCVQNPLTRECDHHTTSLDVHFGILKDGRVQFVEVVRSADYAVYDEYATRAILLAQPFPPVPPALMATRGPGSTGIPISARFSYVVESSLTNLLR